jgi:hypothetical protein
LKKGKTILEEKLLVGRKNNRGEEEQEKREKVFFSDVLPMREV